jgi:hypothetical protein
LCETVAHALLGLGGKVAEAGLIFERVLLGCKRKVAVTIHPLRQVFLIGLRTDLFRPLSRTGRVHGRP